MWASKNNFYWLLFSLWQNVYIKTMIKLYLLRVEGNILYDVEHLFFCLFSIFANNSKVQEAKTFYITDFIILLFCAYPSIWVESQGIVKANILFGFISFFYKYWAGGTYHRFRNYAQNMSSKGCYLRNSTALIELNWRENRYLVQSQVDI